MISKARQERLWNHLMEVEKQVGQPLRKTPRSSATDCPIRNFAPDKDAQGRNFTKAGFGLYYG